MKYVTGERESLAQELGIEILTSEACNLGLRLLCDVNAHGRELLTDYLGLPYGTGFHKPNNTLVAKLPAVASIMLHRDIFPGLAMFYLFGPHCDCSVIMSCKRSLDMRGITEHDAKHDKTAQSYLEFHAMGQLPDWDLIRSHRLKNHPHVGTRNVHAFTGRAE